MPVRGCCLGDLRAPPSKASLSNNNFVSYQGRPRECLHAGASLKPSTQSDVSSKEHACIRAGARRVISAPEHVEDLARPRAHVLRAPLDAAPRTSPREPGPPWGLRCPPSCPCCSRRAAAPCPVRAWGRRACTTARWHRATLTAARV